MDKIAVSHHRAVAVSGGAVFIATSVDHGVDISGKVVGKNIVLHVRAPFEVSGGASITGALHSPERIRYIFEW